MSQIYNKYVSDNGRYNRVTGSPQRSASPLDLLSTLLSGKNERPPGNGTGGLAKMLQNLLPAGMDAGDLLLLLVLLLLYLESEDEDFLIMLVVMGYSVLKG